MYSCRFLSCSFFFSSRRRHTRYWRDWSSDVCSSDLLRKIQQNFIRLFSGAHGVVWQNELAQLRFVERKIGRRRVGKECRSRRSPYHYKKKPSGRNNDTNRERAAE